VGFGKSVNKTRTVCLPNTSPTMAWCKAFLLYLSSLTCGRMNRKR